MTDARIAELEALLCEGFTLPMPVDLILYFEDNGLVVDLTDGSVCQVDVTLSPNVQALCHLYGIGDADLDAIFVPVEDEGIDWDLFDYDGEADDYEDYLAEQDWLRSWH